MTSDLGSLLDCDEQTLETLADLLDTQEGVGSGLSVGLALSDKTGISAYRGYRAVQIVRFFADQKAEFELSDETVLTQLKEAFPSLADKIEGRKRVWAKLLAEKPKAELIRKRQRLLRGAVNTLVEIQGYCDIRPLFDGARTTILDHVPVVLARLTVENDVGDEDTLVVQLNADSVKALEEFLETTKKKLQVMSEQIHCPSLGDRNSR